MQLSYTTLDVFTSTRYTGNPVAIIRILADQSLRQEQKQAIASEFNLSEIVFLHLPASGTISSSRRIDIFTHQAEVPFAGHPTIGTSHYLLQATSQDVRTVITKAGEIAIEKDTQTGEVKAEIPFEFHIHERTFTSSLNGIENPVASIVNGMSFIYVLLPDLDSLALAKENLNGDTYNSSLLDEGWRDGLVGTMYLVSQGADEFGRKMYRTRMFGSREDPGTGSASSGLACWLAGQEEKEKGSGPFKYLFTQGVEMGRRNVIGVEVTRAADGEGIKKVVLSGTAVTVMEGTLEV
ncbi:related to phenazine biosynthesis protein phzC [Rhynchosporium agropyri]|uniref:Related to phenazine biosynthesis protein phzC n=1 Tax=Rhynchosporium agropyri TaxID=914238 RepID=A0A1E1LS91_9HELO|nr:related to phenazine biosynthesis protein phzC [Rhynchosporium agropyri]